MIQNYLDQISQSHKVAKIKKIKYFEKKFKKIQEKFVKFTNYSQITRSKFSQLNNSAFGLPSLKKQIICKFCDCVQV